MFSVFHGLFTLFAIGANHISKNIQDERNKNQSRKNSGLTYFGSHGNEYLIENDKWVSTKTDLKTGHEVIADMKNGKVYYDLTDIKRKNEECKQINQGKTVRYKMSHEKNKLCGKYKQSFCWVDIESQVPVDNVYINGVYFYIRLTDGHLLRLKDGESEKNIHGRWSLSEIINIINRRQDQYINDIESGKQGLSRIDSELFFKNNIRIYIDSNSEINMYKNNGYELRAWQNKLKHDGIVYDTKLKKWINER